VEKERHATELARQRQADEARLQRVREFFRRTPHYARTLRKVRDRSVYRDEFGDWVVTRWLDRLTVFIQNKMGDVFPGRLDHETAQAFLDVVHRVLEEAWAADVTSPDDDRDAPLQGHDLNAFEENCAAMFRSSGFEVRLADASGHTGGDFLAMFMDARLVVQCSRSCSAAGRQAVQEAAEARRFYDAQSAMVISPQGFTASARQLARRAAVMLVDARDLPAFLGRVRSRTDATSRQCISDCAPDLELAGVR
jgi:restriction system protein